MTRSHVPVIFDVKGPMMISFSAKKKFLKTCLNINLTNLIWYRFQKVYLNFSSMKPAEKATMGLARVGSRAALSFAFAFLRRAWRSGEDSDLCSELLHESLEALQSLPEATLFEESRVSSVWLEVVDRASGFLQGVVRG